MEDYVMGMLYLSTKFEFDKFIKNRDLLSDRNQWKHLHMHRLKLIFSKHGIEICKLKKKKKIEVEKLY